MLNTSHKHIPEHEYDGVEPEAEHEANDDAILDGHVVDHGNSRMVLWWSLV